MTWFDMTSESVEYDHYLTFLPIQISLELYFVFIHLKQFHSSIFTTNLQTVKTKTEQASFSEAHLSIHLNSPHNWNIINKNVLTCVMNVIFIYN